MGTFPAASAGWVVSKENFWPENRIVNMLKIRGGYGKTGNDAIDNFLYRATIIGGSNYPFYDGKTEFVGIGYRLKTLENRDLHWEQTAQTNIGADLKLFNDFTLGFDWFNKKTTDILRYVDLPGYIGVTDSPAANVGDMSNKRN